MIAFHSTTHQQPDEHRDNNAALAIQVSVRALAARHFKSPATHKVSEALRRIDSEAGRLYGSEALRLYGSHAKREGGSEAVRLFGLEAVHLDGQKASHNKPSNSGGKSPDPNLFWWNFKPWRQRLSVNNANEQAADNEGILQRQVLRTGALPTRCKTKSPEIPTRRDKQPPVTKY